MFELVHVIIIIMIIITINFIYLSKHSYKTKCELKTNNRKQIIQQLRRKYESKSGRIKSN